jgi:hypothetical protein
MVVPGYRNWQRAAREVSLKRENYQAGGLSPPAGGLPFGSGKPPLSKIGRVLSIT